MKKNMKVRVLAGSMAVFMAAAAAGICGEWKPEARVRAEEETEQLREAAEEILGDEIDGETGELFKDEAVYVKADASGQVTETTVTEWLKNPSQGEVADSSELENIKNIKGEEEFTEGNDGKVTWKAEGEDIYYQGTTKKEVPVGVKVSYKLNGKKVSAEDLKGGDGKVEIRIDYENKSKETVLVDGEETEMYTPFTVVTALMLPTEEYKNITVDHGKIISDADKAVVAGLAFPGLQENLDLKDSDIEIPDSVTITADVKNASVGPTVTLASAQILSEFGLDDVDDFDDLKDSLSALEDAANQLTDGSREAADGAGELADGAGELADGAGELADGAGELADGVNTLNDKGGELAAGVNTLVDGVNAYAGGVDSLAKGSSQVAAGAAGVDDGAGALASGLSEAAAGAGQVAGGLAQAGSAIPAVTTKISGGLDAIEGILSSAQTSLAAEEMVEASVVPTKSAESIVDAAMAQVPEGMTEEQYAAVRAALTSAVQDAQTSQTVSLNQTRDAGTEQAVNAAIGAIGAMKSEIANETGTIYSQLEQIMSGADNLKSGLDQLSAGAARLTAGTSQLRSGAESLAFGAAELNSSSSLLTAGTSRLQSGSRQLTAGAGQLAAGANAVADGSRTLADGSRTLADGSQTLSEGNLALADGMEEFKTSGIDKLTEAFDGDIESVVSRIRAMSDLGKNYKSFAGIQEGMDGSTKFVIETEGVE